MQQYNAYNQPKKKQNFNWTSAIQNTISSGARDAITNPYLALALAPLKCIRKL